MRSVMNCTGAVTILLLGVAGGVFGDPLPPPFDTEPFDTDALGNSGANLLGSFRQDGGPGQFRYFLGTNITAGSLIMDFAVPFTDGPGNDFAILTNSKSWGPLADIAQFEFFLGGNFQGSFTASLAPDQLFQFDLPGNSLIVDRIVVTNITPDPPGIDDLTAMTFDNAGVAYVVPEPSAEVDHFKCYKAEGERVNVTVNLEDQFGVDPRALVAKLKLFCNPVDKNREGILNPAAHLTCYEIKVDEDDKKWQVFIKNQFGEQTLKVNESELLCVPSEKIDVTPEEDDDGRTRR